jgi:Tol biopolymer transport system component
VIGTTLSHYKILEKLGSGGMGDVYVAEDTELGRKVALKVLPTEMAESEERRARFKREARAIAALNHPNIVTVHSVEEANGVHFITMELVRGRRLSELLPRTGFALSKFLDIAIPLTDAVAAAHQEGITHRDLKPDNVMLSDEGRVKVLDFGLAKPQAGLVAEPSDSNVPTQHMTEEGRILGTVSYMSPEQAEGKPVDPRSDIFSLGVVFYEMLTGQRPFHGDTPASTLSAIIKDIPKSASDLRPSIPRDLAKLLRRCLAKDPERRFQTCKDVRNELEDLKEALSTGELQAGEVSASARGRTSRFWLAAGAVVLVVGGALLGSVLWRGGRSAEANVPRLTNPVQVTSAIGVEDLPTWSPEGGRIAYMSDQSGNWDIWVSQVRGGPAVNLTRDYEGLDTGPSWSPDGSQIAFKSLREGGGCFVMSALGGTPRRVVSHPNEGALRRRRPAWSPDGSKLACPYADEESRPFVDIVTLATREVESLQLRGGYQAADLSWSPDGRFLAYIDAINWAADTTRLWVVGLSGDSIPLSDGTTEVWSPTWSPDAKSLFYVSNRGGSKDLWMQELNEDATPHGEPVAITTGLGIQSASLLADGTRIAYSKGGRFANAWRVPILPDHAATWSDAAQLTFDQAYVEFLDVSPDGRRLALNSNRSGFPDLWTLPAEGGEMQPLTSDPAPDWAPSWSPDGKEVAFYSGRTGNRDIFVMPSDGGPARQLTTHPGGDIFPRWSPDGQHITYASIREGNYDIWSMSASGAEQERLTDSGGFDNLPDWSPDGQWIAFVSGSQNGTTHISRIPATGGEPEQLTERHSFFPRWSRDGRVIYFLGRQDDIWALALEGHKERLLADLSGKPGRQGGFALATDGEYLYFTWEETLGDIWVMDVEWDE